MQYWRKLNNSKYSVSNDGLSRNDKTGRILKQTTNNKGYSVVHLSNDGTVTAHLTHRLVAEAFIDNPDNKPYVDHIDTNRQNNCVDNLRWCTPSENNQNPASKTRMKRGKIKAVVGVNIETNEIVSYPSANAAKVDGFNKNYIYDCCKGKKEYYKGYRWYYEENYAIHKEATKAEID